MKRLSWLPAIVVFLTALSFAPSAFAGGGSGYGCYFCEVRCDIDGCYESCAVPLPDTWGDGIKCVNGRLGCYTSGGACLYIVVNSRMEVPQPRAKNANGGEEQPAAKRIDYF